LAARGLLSLGVHAPHGLNIFVEVSEVGAVLAETGPARGEDEEVALGAGLELPGCILAERLEQLATRFGDAQLPAAQLDSHRDAEGVHLGRVTVPRAAAVGVLDKIPIRLTIIQVL